MGRQRGLGMLPWFSRVRLPVCARSSVTVQKRGEATAVRQAPAAKGKGLSVMVVESPTKAAKIQQFLGSNYKVLASYGHIRDLPAKQGSVKPEQNFHMVWEFMPGAAPRYREIEEAVRGASRVGD